MQFIIGFAETAKSCLERRERFHEKDFGSLQRVGVRLGEPARRKAQSQSLLMDPCHVQNAQSISAGLAAQFIGLLQEGFLLLSQVLAQSAFVLPGGAQSTIHGPFLNSARPAPVHRRFL